MQSFDDVSALLEAAAKPLGKREVTLADAAGHVLAEDVTARIDSPRTDVSAMDGYAIRESDLPGPFTLKGTSSAGTADPAPLGANEAMRIFTGAHLPAGADRVLVQEIVAREGDTVRLTGEYGDNRHIRHKANDYAAGQRLLIAGTKLTYRNIPLLAGADRTTAIVWRRPRIAVLSTGDELAEPGTALERPGALPESVSYGVAALARAWGSQVTARRSVVDDPTRISAEAASMLAETDVLVTIGGASVGERDFAQSSLAGGDFESVFSKAAIRPGKPIWTAYSEAGKFVIGLPGNPTSALVTARLFLAPLIEALGGGKYSAALDWFTLPICEAVPAPGAREHFARGQERDGRARPLANQQSSSQATLAQADLLIRQAGGSTALAAGDDVRCLRF